MFIFIKSNIQFEQKLKSKSQEKINKTRKKGKLFFKHGMGNSLFHSFQTQI